MSDASSIDIILSQAGDREKEYDWLGAAEFCGKAIGLVSETDFLKRGEVQERMGYAFYRAAMQAESVTEFRGRMSQSVANYDKAKESYEKTSESGKTPRILRCDAMIAYIGYWLASETPEKKRLIDESWKLAKEALEVFEECGEPVEYGKTYNQLSTSAVLGFTVDQDFLSRKKRVGEAQDLGVRAIKSLSDLDDYYELARVYSKTAFCFGVFAYHFLDAQERDSFYDRAENYWVKANELSEETAIAEFVYPVFGPLYLFGTEGTDRALNNFKKVLEIGKKTRDNFVVGAALDWLEYHTAWKIHETENPDEQKELLITALQHSEDARSHYSKIGFVSPRCDLLWIEAPYTEYNMALADLETNLDKRRNLLEKAVKATLEMLNQAEESGYPDATLYAHHVTSNALEGLAKLKTELGEKKNLLEKALDHRNYCVKLTEQLNPFLYWNRGVMLAGQAEIRSELSDFAKDVETKKNMLQEAALNEENSINLRLKDLEFLEKKASVSQSLRASLCMCQVHLGNLLNRVYALTYNLDYLRKAIQAFQEAADSLQKIGQIGHVAECYWAIGQTYDKLGEHLRAAESFDVASKNYRDAIEKLPQLKNLYQDHASYMQAWSEIEKARHHHEREQYHLATQHFETAANIHRSLKQWSYLAPNYAAWAQVEQAEELSRDEQSEEALEAFKQASQLFSETRRSLQAQFDNIENSREKDMATNMLKTSDLRREYCSARAALEEAKIFDKKGEHSSSSEKYGFAADTLEKTVPELELEQERREFRFIISLARAWQKMTRAEAEGSPTLYGDAAQLFEEARELSPNEKTRMLALGHSRFCKALEAGSRFVDTGDPTIHVEAERFLEAAAKYYLNAGFQKASEYAKATRLLFDAYVSIDDGKKEKDPEKKARLYAMAEKILQTSAGSFMKAEHPEKREQVLRILEDVQAERELATSLIELLHAPSIISSTSAFPSPTPTHEGAIGLENFANAEIQANLIARQKELKIGEKLYLEIELVNAGKGPATLTKISEVVPEGFELRETPKNYRAEDSYINMKGKRLDPLKTEELRLVLKPKVQGAFQLKPRIQYLDENGKYKSHEPEPITITVKELGIKGWLKGER